MTCVAELGAVEGAIGVAAVALLTIVAALLLPVLPVAELTTLLLTTLLAVLGVLVAATVPTADAPPTAVDGTGEVTEEVVPKEVVDAVGAEGIVAPRG
jgi:hypothetical protein